MEELQVKKLTLDQAEEVYKKYLMVDFPREEVKPFPVIRKTWEKKSYCAYGFYEKTPDDGADRLCSYAFLMADIKNQMLLLDYFAVSSQLRGSGYGSKALNLLQKECADWNGIVVEVEDDELVNLDMKTRDTRQRRIAFYTNAGCRMTTTRSRLWSVDYRIMVMPLMDSRADENAAGKITSVYQCMYEEKILKKYFEITAE